MKHRRWFHLPVITLLLIALSSSATAQTSATPDPTLVLSGGTIYPTPTDKPISNGVVIIRDGKIIAVGRRGAVKIPAGARTLDCSGLTITAGFWNSHVHFMQRKWANADKLPADELTRQLQDMLTRFGFTSVVDLTSPWQNTQRIRARIESGEIAGPRLRSTGEALIGKGWLPPDVVLRTLGNMLYPLHEVTTAEEARAAAQKLLESGTDGLKIMAAQQAPPFASLSEEIIRAAVTEAHRRNKPVFAHPQTRDGLLASVRGGVDILAHTTPASNAPWDDEVLRAMRQANVAVIPTLQIWKDALRHERVSFSDQWIKTTISQLRQWVATGGVILFGTDVGAANYDPSDEYTLLAEAGLSFRQILASLTTAPAERFGEAQRLGKIAPGFIADIVVLNGDPSNDARAFANVRYTIRAGKVIYQAAR